MISVTQRIADLEKAERDLQRGIMHAYGQQRLDLVAQQRRITRQLRMLREDQRPPMGMPEQARRFS